MNFDLNSGVVLHKALNCNILYSVTIVTLIHFIICHNLEITKTKNVFPLSYISSKILFVKHANS